MSKSYEITRQEPQVFLLNGQVTTGFVVRGRFVEFDEPFEIQVPKLDPALVDSKIRSLLAERQKLAELGDSEE